MTVGKLNMLDWRLFPLRYTFSREIFTLFLYFSQSPDNHDIWNDTGTISIKTDDNKFLKLTIFSNFRDYDKQYVSVN